MKVKQFSPIVIILLLYVPASIAVNNVTQPNAYQLAWGIIAQEFSEGAQFCSNQCFGQTKSKDESISNLALEPNSSLIGWPSDVQMSKKDIATEPQLAKWQKNKWIDLPPATVLLDPNGMVVDTNTVTEGFYKLSLKSQENDISRNHDFYVIVAKEWKKDLLAFCLSLKEGIETSPDSQMIHSSISVSHFDHAMEVISEALILSDGVLKTLRKAIESKQDFDAGRCPDLVIGLNKIRFKRFEGAPVEEFVIFIPDSYKSSEPWPVFLYPDNWRVGARNNYFPCSGLIDIWWHTVTNKDIKWKNYKNFMQVLKQKLNIDEDRVYVKGECRNGLAAISLALNYPDQWAECSTVLGNTYRHMAGNALNLPMIFVKGRHNEEHLVGYYDFAVECFKYYGCRYFRHSKTQSIQGIRGSSVPDAIREKSPSRVHYTIESLANPRAYWVQINGREDENFIASVDAIVWGQSILVKTDNVDAYTLNLGLTPVDCNKPVEIIENGEPLDYVTGQVFTKRNEKYQNSLYTKNKSLHGPVADVFTDQYVVVWAGEGKNEKFASQLAGSGPCFEDINLPADFVDTHNIIFVGRLEQSKFFAELTEKLPIVIEEGKLTADDEIYEGDLGVILIYPNPLNTQKYIAIFSGTTDKALGLLRSAWGQIRFNQGADIGIFKAAQKNQIEWLRCEKFNTVWDWHKSWDMPLANLSRTHPKWQWHQWVAKVLREQLKADAMISEDPFVSAELPNTGKFTLRDISRIFKNDWIVKISLKGGDLRKLMTAPFNDIPSRDVPVLVISGISLVKQADNSDILCIAEVDNEYLYTIALHYKAVNGKRMGIVMKNYRLESEGFLVVLLRDYLAKNADINLDAELDSMQLHSF